MSELRAPDPTLTACSNERVRLRREGTQSPPPLVAHRESWREPERGEAWGSYALACEPTAAILFTAILASDIAYQAVPCRECFPDAPKPGERPCTCLLVPPIYRGSLHFHPDTDLAWQVQP